MRYTSFLAFVAIALALLLSSSSVCHAGILLPQQVGFDAQDLDQAMDTGDAAGGASSGSGGASNSWPPNNDDQQPGRLDLLKPSLPVRSSSSSSSSSSAGGAAGSNVVLCLFSGTTMIADDASLGRLAEDHGLSLPEAPGTDLFHPPRAA